MKGAAEANTAAEGLQPDAGVDRDRHRPWFATPSLLVALFLYFIFHTSYFILQPFHEDEAIYAAWALRIARGDVGLWATPVDKPPLALYPMALSIALFGPHDWAARLPNMGWTVAALALLWRIARRRGGSGEVALALALFSPLLWALAPSAFADPPMLALALLALERALANRPAQAGLAFALALLAKPTALFLLPLVLVAVREAGSGEREAVQVPTSSHEFPRVPTSSYTPHATRHTPHATPHTPPFILALAAPLLLAWAWDASRAAPSWWALGAQAYGTLGAAGSAWRAWGAVALAAVGGPLAGACLLRLRPRGAVNQTTSNVDAGDNTRPSAAKRWRWVLGLTALLWIPVHLLLGFQPWERYLLPMVALVALFFTRRPGGVAGLYPTLLVLALLASTLVRPLALEPHDGRWQGIGELGAAVEALPADATVVYVDMGRPLAWYAADARAALVWGGPDEAALRQALAEATSGPRFLAWRRGVALPIPEASARLVSQSGQFALYALDAPR